MSGSRIKVVLYNPRAVFFTMPLALLAIGSELDPALYEVVTVDGRLEADPVGAVLAQLDGALCLGVTVLTGAPISDALEISRTAKRARPGLTVVWGGWHPSMFSRECLDELFLVLCEVIDEAFRVLLGQAADLIAEGEYLASFGFVVLDRFSLPCKLCLEYLSLAFRGEIRA